MSALLQSPVKLFRKAVRSLQKNRSNMETQDSSKAKVPMASSLPIFPIFSAVDPKLKRSSLSLFTDSDTIGDDDYCNVFKWVDPSAIPEAEARHFIDLIEDDLRNVTISHALGKSSNRNELNQFESNEDAALKYGAISVIAKKLSLAYLYIVIKCYMQSTMVLRNAKRLLKKCFKNNYIPRDFVSGISFVILTLEAFLKKQIEEHGDQIPSHLISCPASSTEFWIPTFGGIPESGYMSKYNSLCEKSQVAILAIKYYVMELFGNDIDHRIKLINYIIGKDEEWYEWYACLAITLRKGRYDASLRTGANKSFIPMPSVAERLAIKKAVTLNPNHPTCMLLDCAFVAEMCKTRCWNSLSSHFVYGEIILKSVEQVEEFLHFSVNKILQRSNLTPDVNIGIAELFTLHSANKDFRLAKERIEWVLLFHPNCGNALYHLGLYYLQSKEKNVEKSTSLFARAFECDHSIFPALMNLLDLYLANSSENGDKIMEIISKYLKHPLSSWNRYHIGSLLFVEGCYLYLDSKRGGIKNAVLCWMQCFKACENTWKLKVSAFPHGEYRPVLTLSHIKAAILEQTNQLHVSETEKNILRRMATGSYWYPWSQKRFARSSKYYL